MKGIIILPVKSKTALSKSLFGSKIFTATIHPPIMSILSYSGLIINLLSILTTPYFCPFFTINMLKPFCCLISS